MKSILRVLTGLLILISCTKTNGSGSDKPDKPDNPVAEMLPINSLVFKSGVWAMHKTTEIKKFEEGRGAKVDLISVAVSRESWEAVQNTWFMDNERIPSDFKGNLIVAIPMWPENGNLQDATIGKYNSEWEKLGNSIAQKFPEAYLRIGWEMNIKDWYYKATADNKDEWIQAFKHAVNSIRKASPKFKIIFNPNEGNSQNGTLDATEFYPGDDYVDFIGIDAYDWWPAYTSAENIARHRDGEYGWNWWLNFAKSRNKKFVVPEWGVASANANSGGDNAKYINFVYAWLLQNKDWIEFECYFQEADSYLKSDLFLGNNPKASAEYKSWMKKLKK